MTETEAVSFSNRSAAPSDSARRSAGSDCADCCYEFVNEPSYMRPLMDQADSELLVRVVREGVVGGGLNHVYPGNAARQHPEMALFHARSVAVLG